MHWHKHKKKYTGFSRTLSEPIIGLYPLNNKYNFAIVSTSARENPMTFAVYQPNKMYSHTHEADIDTFVSASGFYLKEKKIKWSNS